VPTDECVAVEWPVLGEFGSTLGIVHGFGQLVQLLGWEPEFDHVPFQGLFGEYGRHAEVHDAFLIQKARRVSGHADRRGHLNSVTNTE
jgi:hypothetical protein